MSSVVVEFYFFSQAVCLSNRYAVHPSLSSMNRILQIVGLQLYLPSTYTILIYLIICPQHIRCHYQIYNDMYHHNMHYVCALATQSSSF